ncbi:MAG: tyrosine-type recombinase/integrase [Acidimicrobiales bacterium]
MGTPKTKVSPVRVDGPLAPYAPAFKAELEAAGYTPLSTASVTRKVSNLSGWLETKHLAAADLSAERIDEFIEARRAAGFVAPPPCRTLEKLLGVLEASGVAVAARPTAPSSATEHQLASFGTYLRDERGLAQCTTSAYVDRARRFLAAWPGGPGVADLSAKDVSDAVLRQSALGSVGATQYFVAGLRAFLRFCFAEGLTTSDLSAAALSATGRRASTLPMGISGADADALLASCDRRRTEGRRDYALLLTLMRLGLRASEASNLTLDDVDWRAGLVVVHGKGRRVDSLPLPDDVGGAIAGYLERERPKAKRRELFLRSLAPAGPLGRGGVACVVRRACVRSGIAAIGPHRLRHTLACGMVAAGVPLPEISQVLRHRSIASTANYARVDVDALRDWAQPWPGNVA